MLRVLSLILNHHHNTTELTRGLRNVKVYVTYSDPTVVPGSNVSNSQCIFDGVFAQNSTNNAGANYFVVPLQTVDMSGQYIAHAATIELCTKNLSIYTILPFQL